MKKIIIIAAIIVLAGGIFLLYNTSFSAGSITQKEKDKQDQVYVEYKIKKQKYGEYIEISGEVTADFRKMLSGTTGKVLEVAVKEGDTVYNGQKLGRIDKTTEELNYLKQLNDYEMAVNVGERQLEIKKKELEIAKERVNKTLLKSDVSGIITSAMIKTGDMISNPQQEIFEIMDVDSLRIDAKIDETDLGKVYKNMEGYCIFDQLNKELPVKLNLLSPKAINNGGSVSIPVKLEFLNSPVKEGDIVIITPKKDEG